MDIQIWYKDSIHLWTCWCSNLTIFDYLFWLKKSEWIHYFINSWGRKRFPQNLKSRSSLINQIINSNPNDKKISGEDSFKLYDTYGFPIDLTSLIASENDFQVDIDGFNEHMKVQKADQSQQAMRSLKNGLL